MMQMVKANTHKRKYRTIYQCLMGLGARKRDVYVPNNNPPRKERLLGDLRLWGRWGVDEVEHMVESLYRKALKKYHPDLNGNERWYHEKMMDINQAYQQAQKLISNHGGKSWR